MIQRFIKILFLILISIYGNAQTHKYYFDATSGNDSYSSIQAQSQSTPWKTITKLNNFATSLVPGDSVLFKCGETFYGEIIMGKSGTSSQPIVFASYGSGAKPIITGFSSVSAWTNVSGNIWQSTSAATTLSTLNMVTVNGSFQVIGRYPKLTDANSGYITTTAFTWAGGSWPISGSVKGVLAGSTDYTGGEVVMRKNHYIIDRALITSQSYSGGSITVNFTQQQPPVSTAYSPQNGYGFFFQNNVNTCTTQGEWYFDAATKKIGMYSVGSPSGVKVSTVDTLVNLNGKNYITFYNISFTGSNSLAFNIYNTSHNIINNCDISYHGQDAIMGFSPSFTLTNSTITYINNNCLNPNEGTGDVVQYNTISNVGDVAGMGQSGDLQYTGIQFAGTNSIISYNVLHDIGYIGIRFFGAPSTVSYNYIYNTCTVKDDGAAIYGGASNFAGTLVDHNIIINSVGAPNGTDGSNFGQGIYVDDAGNHVTISNNTVAQCGDAGIFTNAGTNLTITGNTVYNNPYQFAAITFSGAPSNLTLKNNIFVSRTSSQYCLYTSGASSTWFTNTDSNYYARPVADNRVFNINGSLKALAQWQTYSSQDAHSKKSPISLTDTSQILFYYNYTSSPTTTALGATYIDVYNTPYPGSVTLQSFSSVVLLYSLAAVALGASITQNSSILCNGGTTTLAGNGIGGVLPYTYLWSTGATTRNITASAGTYSLTVTDGAGTKANASLTVTQPLPISITLAYGEAPTNVSVLATGGTPTYTYKIDAGSYQSSNIFSSVAAGNHTITVQDANSCTQVINFTVISGGTPLTISNIVQDSTALCYGGTTSATVTATGGTAPYTYLWSNSQTTQTATNLSAITYTVTVTDAASHVADTFITITQPTIISIVQITYNIISTHGGTTTVYVSATGGTGSLTYQLDASGYGSADSFTTVSAGNHTVYVKDSNGCIISQGFTILQPAANILNYYLKPRNRHIKYIQL